MADREVDARWIPTPKFTAQWEQWEDIASYGNISVGSMISAMISGIEHICIEYLRVYLLARPAVCAPIWGCSFYAAASVIPLFPNLNRPFKTSDENASCSLVSLQIPICF